MGDMLSPVMQAGFAGFAAVLLGILVWLIKALLGVIARSNKVVGNNTKATRANTAALSHLQATSDDLRSSMARIDGRLASRPCMQGGDCLSPGNIPPGGTPTLQEGHPAGG